MQSYAYLAIPVEYTTLGSKSWHVPSGSVILTLETVNSVSIAAQVRKVDASANTRPRCQIKRISNWKWRENYEASSNLGNFYDSDFFHCNIHYSQIYRMTHLLPKLKTKSSHNKNEIGQVSRAFNFAKWTHRRDLVLACDHPLPRIFQDWIRQDSSIFPGRGRISWQMDQYIGRVYMWMDENLTRYSV